MNQHTPTPLPPGQHPTKPPPNEHGPIDPTAADLTTQLPTLGVLAPLTNLRQRAFIKGYIETGGNVTRAAACAGTNRAAHYWWLETDPNYAAVFDDALIAARDRLEGEADRRAVDGVLEPVFHRGEQVGTVRKYSDRLLIARLRKLDPDGYADRRVITGHTSHIGAHLHVALPEGATPEDLRTMLRGQIEDYVDAIEAGDEPTLPHLPETPIEGP